MVGAQVRADDRIYVVRGHARRAQSERKLAADEKPPMTVALRYGLTAACIAASAGIIAIVSTGTYTTLVHNIQ